MVMPAALVALHVGMGGVGVLSGAVALLSRKGGRVHRRAGNVFFVSMTIMAALGAYAASRKPEALSALNGLLTLYLVATSWAIVRRRPGEIRRFDGIALCAAAAIGFAQFAYGLEAARSASGAKHGFPAGAYFTFGTLSLLAAALDARMIRAGGVTGTARIVRHLWRMCVALFIAVASLFLGQQQVFPAALRGTFVLVAPVLLVLLTTVYWLIRVPLSGKYRTRAKAAP